MPFEQMTVGDKSTKVVRHRICTDCGNLISDVGLCNKGCYYDGMLKRPKKAVVLRTFDTVITLMAQDFE